MRRTEVLEDPSVTGFATFRLCRGSSGSSQCLGHGWYDTCLDCIAELDDHTAHDGDLSSAFAPWCELCAAAAEALNGECASTAAQDVDYLNATPLARWLLRRLNRRFG